MHIQNANKGSALFLLGKKATGHHASDKCHDEKLLYDPVSRFNLCIFKRQKNTFVLNSNSITVMFKFTIIVLLTLNASHILSNKFMNHRKFNSPTRFKLTLIFVLCWFFTSSSSNHCPSNQCVHPYLMNAWCWTPSERSGKIQKRCMFIDFPTFIGALLIAAA